MRHLEPLGGPGGWGGLGARVVAWAPEMGVLVRGHLRRETPGEVEARVLREMEECRRERGGAEVRFVAHLLSNNGLFNYAALLRGLSADSPLATPSLLVMDSAPFVPAVLARSGPLYDVCRESRLAL